jgi:hypothetical protein
MVPSEMFDTSNKDKWAAAHEPDKVNDFKKKIRDGGHKPVVAAKVPGSNKLRIIDGHHHYLGYDELGYPVPTYIVHTNENEGPWDEMHSFQKVSDNPDSGGYEPGDKGGIKKSSFDEILAQLTKNSKLSKSEVNYRPATGANKCGTCSMFRGPNGCTLVEGVISKGDVCDRWSAKEVNKSKNIALVGGKYKGSNADQMIWNQNHGQQKLLDNSSKPTKKCDYCQRKATKVFVTPGSVGAFARSCDIHAPQARAEMRWSANNQVSPVNAEPYNPFPRVITQ